MLKKRRDRKAQKSQDVSHGSGSGSGTSNKSMECTPAKSDPKKAKNKKKKSPKAARTSG
jgi:hypothetical protein